MDFVPLVSDAALSVTLLPLVVLGFAVGGVLWWWHAAFERASDRHAERADSARGHGWDYAVGADGFFIVGRTLSCDWTLSVTSQRLATFELGAPDEKRVQFSLRSHEGLPDSPWMSWPGPSVRAAERFLVRCENDERPERYADPQVEALLLAWYDVQPASRRRDDALRAEISPHGVRMHGQIDPADWSQVEVLVGLGLALARRAGLS